MIKALKILENIFEETKKLLESNNTDSNQNNLTNESTKKYL